MRIILLDKTPCTSAERPAQMKKGEPGRPGGRGAGGGGSCGFKSCVIIETRSIAAGCWYGLDGAITAKERCASDNFPKAKRRCSTLVRCIPNGARRFLLCLVPSPMDRSGSKTRSTLR